MEIHKPFSFQFTKYVRFETHPNGGATSLKVDWRVIEQNFDREEQRCFLEEFATIGLSENAHGKATYVMGIIENGSSHLPVRLHACIPRRMCNCLG